MTGSSAEPTLEIVDGGDEETTGHVAPPLPADDPDA